MRCMVCCFRLLVWLFEAGVGGEAGPQSVPDDQVAPLDHRAMRAASRFACRPHRRPGHGWERVARSRRSTVPGPVSADSYVRRIGSWKVGFGPTNARTIPTNSRTMLSYPRTMLTHPRTIPTNVRTTPTNPGMT